MDLARRIIETLNGPAEGSKPPLQSYGDRRPPTASDLAVECLNMLNYSILHGRRAGASTRHGSVESRNGCPHDRARSRLFGWILKCISDTHRVQGLDSSCQHTLAMFRKMPTLVVHGYIVCLASYKPTVGFKANKAAPMIPSHPSAFLLMALTRAIQVIFLQRPIGCIEQRVAMDFQLQNPIILRKSTLFPGCWSPVGPFSSISEPDTDPGFVECQLHCALAYAQISEIIRHLRKDESDETILFVVVKMLLTYSGDCNSSCIMRLHLGPNCGLVDV
ncbi:uncharacterized protein BO96DRAFT_396256 [Aspergillus niger CBS 101883]|uniref:Contig An03c0070, genomic contig n=3 Tax=Aspergillus TaxID=5052 RepID=A2QG90_ASPNC|nr:uncharacterized protein BO96DRAFT_396256 [Aspergillus niger CBS 101883]XP_059600264.1 uncharacterized protein An03g02310 [Aspergillus niger]PYH55076.1 hypothetical protein BO96DRAFT_396256 [Aspergillus niger CBS 101883]RDK38568.1 hypothetical protein M752DRAFT_307145 [Aspergillus phoenicis ATCC 13157]CAK38200.1 unnamed protein product [Aspergillus niger]